MKSHQAACAFLAFLTAAMLYGVNSLRDATTAAQQLAEQSRQEAELAENQVQLAQIQLKSLDAKTVELRRLYNEWQPHFEAHRNSQDAEQRIAEAIRESEVFLISQKFDTREVEKGSLLSKALVADLVVVDDYAKALNWLGQIEETIPICRITKCTLTRGERGNDIHLVVQLQVPILDS